MAKFFYDTFEEATDFDGETEDNATYTPVVSDDTSNPKSGTKNMKAFLTTAWKNSNAFLYEDISAETGGGECYALAQNVMFTADPEVGEDIRIFGYLGTTTGTALCYYGVRNDGGTLKWFIYYRHSAAFVYLNQTAGSAPVKNTNYVVKIYLKRAAGTGVATLWVDGVQVATVGSLDNVDRALNYLGVGLLYSDANNSEPMIVYMDDVAISDVDDVVDGPPSPIIEDITETAPQSASTHVIDYPATVNADDLLIVIFACDDNETIAIEGEGTKWINIYEEDAGNSGPTLVVAWCKAVGDEDGGTFTITTGSTEGSCAYIIRISEAADPDTQPPEVSASASGSSVNPNSASLTPTGGSKEYLFISAEGNDDDDDTTGWPSNMADNNIFSQQATVTLGIATEEVTGSVFDPAQFTIAAGETWEAVTIAVHPIPSGGPILDAFNKLAFMSEPPTPGAWNKLAYDSEPPTTGAWNKLKYG